MFVSDIFEGTVIGSIKLRPTFQMKVAFSCWGNKTKNQHFFFLLLHCNFYSIKLQFYIVGFFFTL